MNSITRRIVFSAAAAVVGATAALAQTAMMGNVPFDFRIGKTVLPAGQYQVDTITTGAARITRFASEDRKHNALSVANNFSANVRTSDEKPRLVFRCLGGECSLYQVFDYNGGAYQWPAGKATAAEEARLAVVYLNRAAKAD
jgi:hypothetical protein